MLIRWEVFKSIWGTEIRGLAVSATVVALWLKQIFINRVNEAAKDIRCPGASYACRRSRLSVSVVGNCCPVKSYWKKPAFWKCAATSSTHHICQLVVLCNCCLLEHYRKPELHFSCEGLELQIEGWLQCLTFFFFFWLK